MTTPALRITARRDGFRRAGMRHPARPVDHEAGTFSAAQVAALKADPMLKVVEIGKASNGKGGKKDGGAAD